MSNHAKDVIYGQEFRIMKFFTSTFCGSLFCGSKLMLSSCHSPHHLSFPPVCRACTGRRKRESRKFVKTRQVTLAAFFKRFRRYSGGQFESLSWDGLSALRKKRKTPNGQAIRGLLMKGKIRS